jgi:hypothetical protein
MGWEHADLSAQAGDHDAKDPRRNPGEQRTGLTGGGALRDLGTDGLEVAGSRRRSRPEPHAAPLADDIDAASGGRRGGLRVDGLGSLAREMLAGGIGESA